MYMLVCEAIKNKAVSATHMLVEDANGYSH